MPALVLSLKRASLLKKPLITVTVFVADTNSMEYLWGLQEVSDLADSQKQIITSQQVVSFTPMILQLCHS